MVFKIGAKANLEAGQKLRLDFGIKVTIYEIEKPLIHRQGHFNHLTKVHGIMSYNGQNFKIFDTGSSLDFVRLQA